MTNESIHLISPYGEHLVDLIVPEVERPDLKAYASGLPSLQLSERALCDLELLAVGAFSPLGRFMGAADYARVVSEMRLADGRLFSIPVTLPVRPEDPLKLDSDVALRDRYNNLLAVMTVEEIYECDRTDEAQQVLGTLDGKHPLVAEMQQWPGLSASGRLRVLQIPLHYDFTALRRTPAQTRALLEASGSTNVVAFQTRNPLHRAHEELTKRAAASINGTLLLHPVVGMTKPGDVDHYTRVRAYKALVEHHYRADEVVLSLLPLAMRMGGPREALWHMLIRRNYGANHFIVGRDHAGPGNDSTGKPFYGPYQAQELALQYEAELGMKVLPFGEMLYLPNEDRYEEIANIPKDTPTANISGTQVREQYLNRGQPLPVWFTRPEVAQVLATAYPARHEQGVCIWFTGLSGAGKSTTAQVLTMMLMEYGRRVTVLDGDVVRTYLSKGLGFSKEDRDTNIRRIGFVASEVVRHGGVAICAAISPYRAIRDEVRGMMEGDFIEVFVDTPIEECEKRDSKGLYAAARRGEVKGFTGIDDPYEVPLNPEVTLNTIDFAPEVNARKIIAVLMERGLIAGE